MLENLCMTCRFSDQLFVLNDKLLRVSNFLQFVCCRIRSIVVTTSFVPQLVCYYVFLLNFWLQEEIFVARAPGRLDVMGGIADYSGSLVLQVVYPYFFLNWLKFQHRPSKYIYNLMSFSTFSDAYQGSMPCCHSEESSN